MQFGLGLPNLNPVDPTETLLRLAQAAHKSPLSPLAFARLVRANLMHRRRLDRLLNLDIQPPRSSTQMELKWAPT